MRFLKAFYPAPLDSTNSLVGWIKGLVRKEFGGAYFFSPLIKFPKAKTMSDDLIEDFKAMKESSRQKKLKNKEFSTQRLKDKGVDFISKNNGVHLQIPCKMGIINFYPSTGKVLLPYGKKARGINSLLMYLEDLK